jgi:hypothetical protein
MPIMRQTRLLFLALPLLASASATADDVTEPSGYRLDDYRAPLPATLHGAHVVDA